MSRGSAAPKVLTGIGLLLLLTAASIGLSYAVLIGKLGADWQAWLKNSLEVAARDWAPSSETVNVATWLLGFCGTIFGAALSFAAAWHFAEINLPKRLQDWISSRERMHRAERLAVLSSARSGLGSLPAPYEQNRWALLNNILSARTPHHQARRLAANVDRLRKQAATLDSATREIQQRQITAHLARGYSFEFEGDIEQAMEEFITATRVRHDDVLSYDIAAGAARRFQKTDDEHRFLAGLRQAGESREDHVTVAMSLRREAELAKKRVVKGSLATAQELVVEALDALAKHHGTTSSDVEKSRCLTLLCEIRLARGTPGKLESKRTEMLRLAKEHDRAMARIEERGGEAYSLERATRVEAEIKAYLADASTEGNP